MSGVYGAAGGTANAYMINFNGAGVSPQFITNQFTNNKWWRNGGSSYTFDYTTDITTAGYDTQPPPRRPAPREFNRYLNASDLLEEFIRFAGERGADADEILQLPIELFVKWLIIRAAEADQEEPPIAMPPLRALPAPQPRCLGCGRWMRRTIAIPLHDTRCADRALARVA